MRQHPRPSLRFADGGGFITRWAQGVMRPAATATAARLREVDASPPAPPPSAPPPPPNPNATPGNPAGIRFQDGGVVPGSGRGDKIPAKYEPGEFVVSNDMIDDNPGLREQLAEMRAETLAARGKTVEEADAKALRYHDDPQGGEHEQEIQRSDRRGGKGGQGQAGAREGEESSSLRRSGIDLHGMDGPSGGVLHSRGGDTQGVRNVRVSLRASTGGVYDLATIEGESPRRQPPAPSTSLATTSDVGRTGYKPNFTMPSSPPPSGPSSFDQEAVQRAREAAARRAAASAAPAAAPPIATPETPKGSSAASKWVGSADEWKDFAREARSTTAGDTRKTGRLAVPEAPGRVAKVGSAIQGGLGTKGVIDGLEEGNLWKAGVGLADTLASGAMFTPAAPLAATYLGARGAWDTGQAVGGRVYNALSEGVKDAIGGTINNIGLKTGLWGVNDDALLAQKAESRNAPDAPNPVPGAVPARAASNNDPHAAANAAKLAASDAQNKAAPAAAPAELPPGYVVRNGNQYSGTNVRGDITINGFAPGAGLSLGSGPNAQNNAAAENLVGGASLRSQSAAMGGMDGMGGQPQPQLPVAPTVRHSGNDWQARNDLRNLEVSASSITNDGGRFDQRRRGDTSPARAAYAAAVENDIKLRGAQPGFDLETNKSNNTLRGNMYQADRTADSYKYTADQKLRGDIFSAQSQAATSRAKNVYDAAVAERNYRDGRSDKTFEQRRQAHDDMLKRVDRYVPINKETGKPDEAAKGQFLQFADNYIAENTKTLANSKDPNDRALAEQLSNRSAIDLGDDEWRFIKSAWDMRGVQEKSKGWLWGSSSSSGSLVPQDYVPTGVDRGVITDRVKNRAGEIAAARLKNPDGDLFSVFGGGGAPASYDRILEEARRQNPNWNKVQ